MIPKIIHTIKTNKKNNYGWEDTLKSSYPDYIIDVWDINDLKQKNPDYDYDWQYENNGELGRLYLSYYYRFYVVFKYGGVFIEYESEIKSIPTDSFFIVNGFDCIDCRFFGFDKEENILSNIMSCLKLKPFVNKNWSLNLYNPGKVVSEALKTNNIPFDTDFNNKVIENITFLYNIEYQEDTYLIHKKYIPKSSIVIPVYNSEEFLKPCILSILNQTNQDFEAIFIDDGSTDSSIDIIKSYNDDRFIIIEKEHSGIVDSLNLGINRSLGEYIIRHDSDDIMLPHRLNYQINFMDADKTIDILSNGFKRWYPNNPEKDSYYSNNMGYIFKHDLLKGNKVAHPCVCMRASSIKKLPFKYEEYYKHAEDYKLWFTSLSHNLFIYSDKEVVTWYRQHDNQITKEKYDEMVRTTNIIKNAYTRGNNESNELTCIIPFQNEAHEIEKTVASIRGTAHVNILLINDCSTDEYNYKKIADIFECDYIETQSNMGVAACRDFGINHCRTEYFLLLDGHMRFYDMDWDIKLLNELKSHKNGIVTGNTLIFDYDVNKDTYNGEYQWGYKNISTRAAEVNMFNPGWEFTGTWTNKEFPGYEQDSIVPISCCMGAVYASNKTWWNKIDGLKGLEKWGQDEPYMSIKTWLAGGEVLLMKNFGVGHLYRSEAPYVVPNLQRLLNRVFLIFFFYKDQNDIKLCLENFKKLEGEQMYMKIINYFILKKDYLESLKNNFWNNIAIHELSWFEININNNVHQ